MLFANEIHTGLSLIGRPKTNPLYAKACDSHKAFEKAKDLFLAEYPPTGREQNFYQFTMIEGSMVSPTFVLSGYDRARKFASLTGMKMRRLHAYAGCKRS